MNHCADCKLKSPVLRLPSPTSPQSLHWKRSPPSREPGPPQPLIPVIVSTRALSSSLDICTTQHTRLCELVPPAFLHSMNTPLHQSLCTTQLATNVSVIEPHVACLGVSTVDIDNTPRCSNNSDIDFEFI